MPQKHTSSAVRQRGGNKKIIFVEDEKYQQELYKKIFSRNGFDIKVITEPENAFEIIKVEQPCLILLDLVFLINGQLKILESKEKGFKLLKKIKTSQETKNIPVLVVTNLSDKGANKEKALELGADGYINKSKALPKQLIRAVKNLC